MYNGMLHLHSLLRWIILILLLVAVIRNFTDRHKAFTPGHKKVALFTLICADLLLLVGLYQWVVGDWGLMHIQNGGMSGVMKNPVWRFFAIEHFAGMLIAIILIHVGYTYTKKNISDSIKHKRVLLYYGLALLIILISIPWPFREVGQITGRTWFPGM
ncbi:MAG: hypothetical protein IPH18_15055 [Chitinophagaceae bacterium]|nr:hypothetical protein [Chitinophagaceae bacterium]MBK8952601.1 hypothetical protein [Chitinophagaceae bacterium]